MSKFFTRPQATHTDTVAFSTLVVAGLLVLGLGTWSPLPQTETENVAQQAPATKVASQTSHQVPAAKNARG
ncbi:hypothetical protein BURK2_00704 [Burkholderiales bacterium]|nr:MAG: hypothetical protein F9K47_15535 [Burkholderiales bacterium]CAG0960439.1 hypothetical protein BURK2_00704 [Burkholderiales bacterium]